MRETSETKELERERTTEKIIIIIYRDPRSKGLCLIIFTADMASLNPIYLLSRTECDISTLYYCFFFLDIHDGSEELQVCKKIPSTRQKMDDIEAGLKLFATRKSRDGTALATEEEKFNFTAMTTSDGSRYFAYWIQIGHKKIAGVRFVLWKIYNISLS